MDGAVYPRQTSPGIPSTTTVRPKCPGERSSWCKAAWGTAPRALHPAKRAGLLRGDHLRFEMDAQRLRDAGAVCGIGLGAIGDMTLLNVLRGAADLASRIVE